MPKLSLEFQSDMQQFLGSMDNPQLLVYRVMPNQVRYMREWALEYHELPMESLEA